MRYMCVCMCVCVKYVYNIRRYTDIHGEATDRYSVCFFVLFFLFLKLIFHCKMLRYLYVCVVRDDMIIIMVMMCVCVSDMICVFIAWRCSFNLGYGSGWARVTS